MTQGAAALSVTLLTPAQAGERLGVSRSAIYRYVERGWLRGVYIGLGQQRDRLRLRDDDLDEFIETRTRTAPTTTDDILAASS
jgi:excisionase family DNA binding protein